MKRACGCNVGKPFFEPQKAIISKNYNAKKDNRLRILRFQGGYLYDKGENDELFHVNGCPQPIYNSILSRGARKVKDFEKKILFSLKSILSTQKMLKIHIFTLISQDSKDDCVGRVGKKGDRRAEGEVGRVMHADCEADIGQAECQAKRKNSQGDGNRQKSQGNAHGAGDVSTGTRRVRARSFFNKRTDLCAVLGVRARAGDQQPQCADNQESGCGLSDKHSQLFAEKGVVRSEGDDNQRACKKKNEQVGQKGV